jgi:hypothetical protein
VLPLVIVVAAEIPRILPTRQRQPGDVVRVAGGEGETAMTGIETALRIGFGTPGED